MRRLIIWVYAVCKSLLLSPVAVEELRKVETLSREATVKIVFLPIEKWSTQKGKNLLPLGANSFLSEKIPFIRNLMSRKENGEVTKVVSLVKMASLTRCIKSTYGLGPVVQS